MGNRREAPKGTLGEKTEVATVHQLWSPLCRDRASEDAQILSLLWNMNAAVILAKLETGEADVFFMPT